MEIDHFYGDSASTHTASREQTPEQIPLHLRSDSYRFPDLRNRYSIVDPFDLLDDEMLTDLTSQIEHRRQLKGIEVEMRTKLVAMLREMDLNGEGRLDAADFTSGVMLAVEDYDDIMEDAELLFETLADFQDDSGMVNIEDIVDAVMFDHEDGAAVNIKRQLMDGMRKGIGSELDDREEAKSESREDGGGRGLEDMPDLVVAPKQVDPNAVPFKPMYQITKARQHLGAPKASPRASDKSSDDDSYAE